MQQLEAVPIAGVPDPAPMQREGTAVVERAKSLKVTTRGEYELAAGPELRHVKDLIRSIEDAFRDPKTKAYEAHKSITKLESDLLAFPKEAKRILERAMDDFLLEDERQTRLERARLQEEERKKAEEAKLAQAIALEQAGDRAAAEQVLESAVAPAPVHMEKAKAAGVSYKTVYRFDVVDATKVGPKFLTPDIRKIQDVVDGMKYDAAELVGGIRVFEKKQFATRRS